MGAINLVLADKDDDFLNKISKYIIDKRLGFSVAVFTDKDALLEYLQEDVVDILLIDETFADHEYIVHANAKSVILMTTKNNFIYPGFHSIKKFQKSENFLQEMTDIFYGKDSAENINIEKEVKERDIRDTSETKVVGFYSPTGGSGNTSIALAFAASAANDGGNSFYINLEKFNSSFVFFTSEKIILPEDVEDIVGNDDFYSHEKINIISDKDKKTGIGFFPFSFNDEKNLRYLKDLIKIIKDSNLYKYITIDASRDNYFNEEIIEICNKLFVTVNETSFSGKKTNLFLNTLVTDKTHLILNKKDVVQQEEKTFEDIFEYTCEIPYIPILSQLTDLLSIASKFERYTSQMKSIL
ncbi:MAG: hypothetical protein LBV08_04865 [Clostridiales bacterium]|nr:hypothetical protein [Clostridiales bacterium]